VKRIGEIAGQVTNELPFEGLSTSKRVTHLLTKAMDIRAKQSSVSEDDTWMRLKFGYEQLRESWEYAVEEVLLASVVGRFVPDIQTNRLNAVIVDDADYLEVDVAMSKCSQSTHAKPPAAGKAFLTVNEFEMDIKALEAFRKRVQFRNTATTATRKASLKPPAS